MKNERKDTRTTELVMILDRSGSMAGLESDTVGGFNAMIAKQRKEEGECFVSTVLFDDDSFVVHDRIPLAEVPPMTDREYTVRGCTALIDAMGRAIRHIGNIHKYARPEDVPAKTVFVITTDGMENASREFTADQVRAMVEKKKALGWEFLFIGANIDAVQTAHRYGISRDRAVDYNADGRGTRILYQSVSDAVSSVRANCPLGGSWRKDLDDDIKKRGRRRKESCPLILKKK